MATKGGKQRKKNAETRHADQVAFSGEGRNMAALARGSGGYIKDDWRCGRPFKGIWNGGNPLTDSVPLLRTYDQLAPMSSGAALRGKREAPTWMLGLLAMATAIGR